MIRFFLLLCLLCTACGRDISAVCDIVPGRMTCEYMDSPSGLDIVNPRFSWIVEAVDTMAFGQRQSAYRIEVAADPKFHAFCWDSGWVESSQTQLVVYAGVPLASDRTYYWRVRVRDGKGVESEWSPAASWSTGLFEVSDWTARWIGSDEIFDSSVNPDCNISDPWFRKSIRLKKRPAKAVMFVASVGYHELYVNGRKVGDHILAPVVTDNSQRARYIAYDIAPFLQRGENVLSLWLGTSWSIFEPFRIGDKPMTPIVIAQADIRYSNDPASPADLRIVTDGSWVTHPSPNKLLGKWGMGSMGGELWDARKEIPDWNLPSCDLSTWRPATVYTPSLVLSAQNTYPNRKHDEIHPVAIEECGDGSYRVDMGVNFAGWIEADLRGEPGDRIDLLYSEREYLEMTFRNYSACILGESGRCTFRNRFNYGSGRWITVKGLREKPRLSDIRGWMVRTDYPDAASFVCSDDLQNWIYDRVKWTFENLSIGGYVVDCPQRERLGYGDAAFLTCETGMFNYALGSFYTKWMQDWRDVQGRMSNMGPRIGGGILPHTAPTYDGGGGPAWGGCVVTLPWLVYNHYGDRRILEENFMLISRWLDFLDSHTKKGILKRWGGDWDYLADWLWPGASAEGMNNDKPQAECFNSCFYAFNLSTAAKIAAVLGRDDMAALWNTRANEVRRAVHRKYYNPHDRSYSDCSMGNLALALIGEVPPAELRGSVMQRLEEEILIHCKGHIDVGIMGGALLFKLLRDAGRDDLIWSMTSQTDYPGWGLMRESGATTIWEMWEKDLPNHSLLHGSFLYPGAWYIDGVAGIRHDTDVPGFGRFVVRAPRLPEERIAWARGSYDSPVGTIRSSWKRLGTTFTHEVTVPANARATVWIPASEKEEVSELSGFAEPAGHRKGYVLYDVPAGHYCFRVGERR